jgi:hypothetical protein
MTLAGAVALAGGGWAAGRWMARAEDERPPGESCIYTMDDWMPERVRLDSLECQDGSGRCKDIETQSQYAPLDRGVSWLLGGCEPQNWHRTTLDFAWRLPSLGGHMAETIVSAEPGEVFPVRDRMAEVLTCHIFSRPGPPLVRASLFFDRPAWKSAAPAPGNVILPYKGEALLDHRYTAALSRPDYDDAGHRILTVLVGDSLGEERGATFVGLRIGDSFRWGGLRATLVRYVEGPRGDDAPFMGWAEVKLSDEAGSSVQAED